MKVKIKFVVKFWFKNKMGDDKTEVCTNVFNEFIGDPRVYKPIHNKKRTFFF